MNRPCNEVINLDFYKQSGKWYSSGKAVVNHFLFEDGFKQDIVNTQDALVEGWQNDQFIVVTSSTDDSEGFFNALFKTGSFKGLVKDEDHPIEDCFGDEILSGETYYKFGENIVLEQNLKKYLTEKSEIECYKAQ